MKILPLLQNIQDTGYIITDEQVELDFHSIITNQPDKTLNL